MTNFHEQQNMSNTLLPKIFSNVYAKTIWPLNLWVSPRRLCYWIQDPTILTRIRIPKVRQVPQERVLSILSEGSFSLVSSTLQKWLHIQQASGVSQLEIHTQISRNVQIYMNLFYLCENSIRSLLHIAVCMLQIKRHNDFRNYLAQSDSVKLQYKFILYYVGP